jgi:hypothetical protein
MVKPISFFSILITLCMPLIVFANDTVLQGIGGSDVMPLHEKRLVMQSEDIIMTVEKEHFVKIEATYRFKNISAQKIKVDLGFPELSCQDEGEIDSADGRSYIEASKKLCGQKKAPKFRGFQTWVNQQKINYTIVSTKATQVRSVDIPAYEVVYAYSVDFEPHQEIEVKHTYQLLASESMGKYFTIYYLTKTGNFWAEPIGRATFTLRHEIPLLSIDFPDEYLLKSFKREYINQKYQIEFKFEMFNWLPKKDLLIAYQLLAPTALSMSSADFDVNCPQTKYMQLTEYVEQDAYEMLASLAPNQQRDPIQKCLNLINAHYGYSFKNPIIRSMFYRNIDMGLSLSQIKSNCHVANDCYKQFTIPLAEIPGFTEKAISRENQIYLRYLKIIADALKK